DQFFASDPSTGPAQMVDRLRRRISEIDGMTIDQALAETAIAGRPFTRLDYSGAGLFRAILVGEDRCHLVSFNLTTVDPDERTRLAQSLGALSLGEAADPARQTPLCLKGYATAEHLVSRLEPAPVGPRFAAVPARIIIGIDGRVRHVHVIRGSAAQKES